MSTGWTRISHGHRRFQSLSAWSNAQFRRQEALQAFVCVGPNPFAVDAFKKIVGRKLFFPNDRFWPIPAGDLTLVLTPMR